MKSCYPIPELDSCCMTSKASQLLRRWKEVIIGVVLPAALRAQKLKINLLSGTM
jgi:hypothetical protein